MLQFLYVVVKEHLLPSPPPYVCSDGARISEVLQFWQCNLGMRTLVVGPGNQKSTPSRVVAIATAPLSDLHPTSQYRLLRLGLDSVKNDMCCHNTILHLGYRDENWHKPPQKYNDITVEIRHKPAQEVKFVFLAWRQRHNCLKQI